MPAGRRGGERQPEASVLLFVREEWLEKAAPQVEEQGVFVITKPINKSGFFDALRWSQRRARGCSG